MIVLDYKDRRPIYEQIVERFQELILVKVLECGEKLPSVRNLAMELSINPNTIQRAYMELERQGFIYSIKGKGRRGRAKPRPQAGRTALPLVPLPGDGAWPWEGMRFQCGRGLLFSQ